jgi:hypothetical protein
MSLYHTIFGNVSTFQFAGTTLGKILRVDTGANEFADKVLAVDSSGNIVPLSGSGVGLTELTGDVTAGPGTGAQAATIANDAVTYAKMQNVSATDKVLGRATAGAGDVEEITCTAAGRALIDDADAAAQRTTLGFGTGTYTPSTTGVANVSASDGHVSHYIKVGNRIVVFGVMSVTPTAASTTTTCRMALPVVPTFSAATDVRGSATFAAQGVAAGISADTTNHEALFSFTSGTTAQHFFNYQLIYIV